LHRLGANLREIGNLEKAVLFTKEAIAINNAKLPGSQPSFLANSYFNMGLYYKGLLMPDNSLSYFDSCIQIGSLYPEKTFLSLLAFEQKAFYYFETGDFQKSIDAAN